MLLKSFSAGLAGALMLAVAGQAAAASVIGATRIEITSALPDYLQITDIEALAFGTLENVASSAEGASATATSVYLDASAENAIDADPLSPFYSGTGNASEKLTIQLARTATLSSLRVVGRSDGCCRERDFWNISIFNSANAVLFNGQFDARTSSTFDAIATFDAPPTGAIPEPSTWAMMILGFGAAGAAIRSRRRVSTAAV
jgi:hypothetical protein